ncbi:hypothetical protein SAMN03080601_03253 [Alkalitalea saponilacus]|uniref:Uncharacterized protein n=1 Tax=Alkalitalea saponilacus TaxID=889453 RepID=A0A1T5HTG2_9BACT|nr:hypothetical protein SAMN03080601_03253 [Alkalitalea saponilacus]
MQEVLVKHFLSDVTGISFLEIFYTYSTPLAQELNPDFSRGVVKLLPKGDF